MYVVKIIDTKGSNNGKEWTSRTAVCIDTFRSKDGGGEYVKTYKCTFDCPFPDPDSDVQPLFTERGKVADWLYPDE